MLDANNALTTHEEASNYLSQVSVYPNPSYADVNLYLKMKAADAVKIEILDVTGKIVYSTKENVSSGANTLTLQPGTIASGVYMIRVSGTDFIHSEQLVRSN